jgi:hypothetical protein
MKLIGAGVAGSFHARATNASQCRAAEHDGEVGRKQHGFPSQEEMAG